ncbi:hypothetical protein L6164_034565 [Bauhinia variegata]|uniref:Uncharacterized protein n=1 Tax=Bauhinia variegata TaxID=167791 RepID=A0ACB9KV83_BAUVA|nr:hypothetical protein L6164_034565 [Bauhinia variegata]
MTKSTASQDSGDTMTHLDLFKKFKRFNPLEPSLGTVGFFLVTVFFIGSFFFLDYTAVVQGLRNRGFVLLGLRFSPLSSSSSSSSPSPSPSSLTGDTRVEFLHQHGDCCDVFNGNWVWDESYPLYQSTSCSFLDQGFRCNENGRPDSFYTNWRWQPRDCNLPRFPFYLFLLFSVPDPVAEYIRGKGKKYIILLFYI